MRISRPIIIDIVDSDELKKIKDFKKAHGLTWRGMILRAIEE